MNEALIRGKVEDLLKTVVLPSPTGKASDDGVYISAETDPADPVAECLDRLWLQVKYLVFDLEATRREKRYLRMMLDSRNRRPKNNTEDNDIG